jgi:preprotein translocase SecE subunit
MADQALTVRESGSGDPRSTPVGNDRGEGGIIYKYGRGYWVRVLTAICLGMLFLAGAGWAWRNLATVDLPAKAYTVQVAGAQTGELKTGDAVTLFNVIDGKDVKIGAGVLENAQSSDGKKGELQIGQYVAEPDAIVSDTKRIDAASGSRVNVRSEANAIAKIPVFSHSYLQGGAAGIILLVGFIVIFNYVGRKPSTVDFLIATDEEMRKVNWSTKKTIIDSTTVVIFATFLIAAFIFVWDFILKKALMDWIVRWS